MEWLLGATERAEDPALLGEVVVRDMALPDDWHHHLRDGAALATTVPFAAKAFGRIIVMPNLVPPVTTTDLALAYKARILAALRAGQTLRPLMTLYLTDNTSRAEIEKAKKSGAVFGVKLYPSGATTNSDSGVTNVEKPAEALKAMEDAGLPLLVHGEVVSPEIDIFDRERAFIETTLRFLVETYPRLKIVLEHCTTKDAVDFVKNAPPNVGATITAHHLLYNRNALFAGNKIRPHHFCLPILKAETHRLALVEAATSGNPKFFLGTDSAPHEIGAKHCEHGCAGVFTAHAPLELYAETFANAGKLDNLEAFASFNGPDFYGLPRNDDTFVSVYKTRNKVPASFPFAHTALIPLRANEDLPFKVVRSPPFPPSDVPKARYVEVKEDDPAEEGSSSVMPTTDDDPQQQQHTRAASL